MLLFRILWFIQFLRPYFVIYAPFSLIDWGLQKIKLTKKNGKYLVKKQSSFVFLYIDVVFCFLASGMAIILMKYNNKSPIFVLMIGIVLSLLANLDVNSDIISTNMALFYYRLSANTRNKEINSYMLTFEWIFFV